MKYLFENWNEIRKNLSNKYIMLFLDYDGTLTPIVESPEKAVISREPKKLLEKLSKNLRCKIAIISGRSLKDIKNMAGLKNIIYSGNHGLEIEGPRIKFESPVSPRYRSILEHINTDLTRKLSSIKGVILEDKGFSLSIHFRQVNKKQIPYVKTIVHETAIIYLVRNRIKIKPGKMVLEIRPPIKWDKGDVVLWLLARQRFYLKNKSIFPIYIGDDLTDEDAFEVLRNKGLTVFVGESKTSHAEYFLKNTKEVTEFLRQILTHFKT